MHWLGQVTRSNRMTESRRQVKRRRRERCWMDLWGQTEQRLWAPSSGWRRLESLFAERVCLYAKKVGFWKSQFGWYRRMLTALVPVFAGARAFFVACHPLPPARWTKESPMVWSQVGDARKTWRKIEQKHLVGSKKATPNQALPPAILETGLRC